MANMRTVMPALQRAKPAKVGAEAAGFLRVALPAQRRETRIVKDLPADEIAREIVEWIGRSEPSSKTILVTAPKTEVESAPWKPFWFWRTRRRTDRSAGRRVRP